MDTKALFILIATGFLFIAGCIGQPPSQGQPFGGNPNGTAQGGPNCTSYSVEKCPSSCTVCPPCEMCSSISCNTVEFCQSIGFNRSWWEEVRPKNENYQPGPQGQMPLQPGQQPPQNGPGQPMNNSGQPMPPTQEFALRVNPNASLPAPPQNAPEGKWMNAKLGDVQVKYFSTAITRGLMEAGTDYFITLNNTGSSTAKICAPACCSELRSFVPSWNLHFFALQDAPFELAPGQVKKLRYFASLDKTGLFNVTFRMWQCENEGSAISLPVTFGATDENFWGKETSYISGMVKDNEGKPVAGATVVAVTGCGRTDFKGNSDSQGNYEIPLLGMEDVDAIYLGRDLGCTSKDYWLAVEKDGYEYYFADGFAPTRSAPAKADIVLQKRKEADLSYELEWEKKVDGNYGFFWVKPSADWSVFAATQAKHPPELGKPGAFYLLDEKGNVLWGQPTENECWGIDIASDGNKVAAGCHDNYVYVVERGGKLLWKEKMMYWVRAACFSHDGNTLLSGTGGTLFNSATGAKTEVERTGDWLRTCAFYPDDTGFVIGSRETGSFSPQGTQEWQQIIGEFPMYLGVDENRNVYASGKSRTVFSFDKAGSVRWTYKISEPSVTAGANTVDGSRVAMGSVGGTVYLFNGNGTLLWRRGALGLGEFGAVGHNAMALSQDGKLVVAGTAPNNCIIAYNEYGTVVWKGCSEADASNPDLLLGVTNVQVSPDKARIIASYGDNYIRMFRLKE